MFLFRSANQRPTNTLLNWAWLCLIFAWLALDCNIYAASLNSNCFNSALKLFSPLAMNKLIATGDEKGAWFYNDVLIQKCWQYACRYVRLHANANQRWPDTLLDWAWLCLIFDCLSAATYGASLKFVWYLRCFSIALKLLVCQSFVVDSGEWFRDDLH